MEHRYRFAVDTKVIIAIAIILIALLVIQNFQSKTTVAKESPPPFVMEPGAQYPVSQLLEEQNRKGVFVLPLVESYGGKYQLPAVRNIYFSQLLEDETTTIMTGMASKPFTVIEINFYDSNGEVIHKETVVSQPYPLVPQEASLVFTGRNTARILDERMLTLIPSSEFEKAKTISIKYL